MDHVRQKSGIIAAKVRKSRHKRLRKTVFLKAKKETTCKHFHQSSLFALCLYSVACDVPPGKFMFFWLSVFYNSPYKICPSVFLSLKSHLAKYVFMFLCLLQLTLQNMFFCLSVFYKSPCKICLYVLMSSTTHFANHVFQSSFLAFCLTKKVSSY